MDKPCLRCQGYGHYEKDGYTFACACSMGGVTRDKPLWLRNSEAMEAISRGVPSKVRQFTAGKYRYALDHRGEANRLMIEWLRCRLRLNTGHPSLYFWGPTGTGKSVIAAEACRLALVEGLTRTFLWLSEGELVTAIKSRYTKDAQSDARKTLSNAKDCGLLIIDEFTTQGLSLYSTQAKREVVDMLADRFDNDRPTIMTSNRQWRSSEWPDRLVSRWERSVREVEISGCDLRSATSGGDVATHPHHSSSLSHNKADEEVNCMDQQSKGAVT